MHNLGNYSSQMVKAEGGKDIFLQFLAIILASLDPENVVIPSQ